METVYKYHSRLPGAGENKDHCFIEKEVRFDYQPWDSVKTRFIEYSSGSAKSVAIEVGDVVKFLQNTQVGEYMFNIEDGSYTYERVQENYTAKKGTYARVTQVKENNQYVINLEEDGEPFSKTCIFLKTPANESHLKLVRTVSVKKNDTLKDLIGSKIYQCDGQEIENLQDLEKAWPAQGPVKLKVREYKIEELRALGQERQLACLTGENDKTKDILARIDKDLKWLVERELNDYSMLLNFFVDKEKDSWIVSCSYAIIDYSMRWDELSNNILNYKFLIFCFI